MKSNLEKGITLIALIITIIILLILAGITINFMIGDNGILNKAVQSGNIYEEKQAREKLEIILMDIGADKHIDPEYNENDYINSKLIEQGIAVNGDFVNVDGWKFEIDRSVPKIAGGVIEEPEPEEEKVTKKEKAIVLDGEGYIETNLQQSNFIETTKGFTIGARVKISNVGQQAVNNMGILGNSVGAQGFVWQFNQKTQELGIGNQNKMINIDYQNYYNKWIDIVTTYENGVNKIYINGQLIKEEENTITPYGNLLIGIGYSSQPTGMKGMIASVKVWNKSLEQEEVEKLNLLTDTTSIKSANIKLQTILDSEEDVQKIGEIKGEQRYELRDFELKYAVKFLGGTYINTNWNQTDFMSGTGEYTIAARIKINKLQQTGMAHMNILGYHPNGYTWQFNSNSTQLNIAAKYLDYTPYYDQWIDIVHVHNNTINKLYINKEFIHEANFNFNYTYKILIGLGYESPSRSMKGEFASIKMWRKELTKDEVEQIDMLQEEGVAQEQIYGQAILESNEKIAEIGSFVGSNYTYVLRH
ncbi:MAG: LamG domain-containing protein [Clostridia bacterium]|nr:LamG domain-containing protein [Clostridia bacterium]